MSKSKNANVQTSAPDEATDQREQEAAKALEQVTAAIGQDEYAGQGGRYLLDPVTGKRTPITDEE